MSKEKQLAQQIIENLGGKENLLSVYHCMTRLRAQVKDKLKVNLEALKKLEGVMGVVQDDSTQVILGPGKVNQITEIVYDLLGIKAGEATHHEKSDSDRDYDLDKVNKQTQQKYKKKNQTPFKQFLRRIAQIFIPLLPGLIGAGLISGIANFAITVGVSKEEPIIQILLFFSSCLFAFLGVFVGMNTTKEFGGTPVLGGITALFIFNPALANLKVTILGESLIPGRGGLIAVMIAAWLVAVVERNLRKAIPAVLDIIIIPLITLVVVGFATFYVVQPLGSLVSEAIANGVTTLIQVGGPIVGYVLAALFLPLVITGLHHGLIPIHTELINTLGATPLLPILAMAGAGQVGAAIAILVKTKNKKLKTTIPAALVPGFLGIGEPLLYGVTLPLGRPFLTACLGGGFGGAFQAIFHTATKGVGISGIPLSLLVVDNKILIYLCGLLVAYTGGFALTYLFGYKEEMAADY